MQLSAHFSLAELTVTETGLDNTPDASELPTLKLLAEFMEKVRAILGGHPITVHSAHRSPAVNAAVGGVPNSAHELDFACDFTSTFGSPYEVCMALSAARRSGRIAYDQLIQEGTWAHISRDPRLRSQDLTLTGGPGQYTAGITP